MRRTVCMTLATVAALAGCGNLGTGEERDRVEEPQLLRKADVARHPVGSPARTFLEWWRALQFASSTQAVRHYARDVEVNPRRLKTQLEVEGHWLGLRARPKVLDVIEDGDKATVYALFTKAETNPNGRADKVRTPRAFDLVREQGEWKMADNRYIEKTLRDVKTFIGKGTDQQRSRPGQ